MHLAYLCVRTHCYNCRYLMRSEFKSRVDTFYVFSSFFYSKLLAERDDVEGKISASIHRWTRNEDIFRFKYLVVPINEKYGRILPSLSRAFIDPSPAGPIGA